jgi:hypothetical protein
MGISSVMWRCPKCNLNVGGSLGELKYHWKRLHGDSTKGIEETTTTASQ